MKLSFYSLALLYIIFVGCENKNDDKLLRLYIMRGDAFDIKDGARSVVAYNYGFYYYPVERAAIFSEEERSIQKHNDEVMRKLEKKWGKGWKSRFEYSVDSLYSIDSLAIEIVKQDVIIQTFIDKTEKYNEEYNYYPNLDFHSYQSYKDEGSNLRNVDIDGYGVIADKKTRVIYLRAILDMSTLKIIEIDTTLRELPR